MQDSLGILGDEPVKPVVEIMPKMPKNLQPSELGYTLRVAPDLVPLVKPMSEFKLHPKNLRKHNVDAIAASLDEYGQQTPITVQKSTGYVCKGNGTYKAARLLGADTIAASVEDFDDDTAWRYLLADNRTSDLASYDRELTLQALNELIDGPGLQGTLWTVDDRDDIQAQLGLITVQEPEYVSAAYAVDAETLAKREAAAAAPGIKMKETSVVLTLADHERFMANVAVLRKVFGTSGVIATIVEAVRRQAALASGDVPRDVAAMGDGPATSEETLPAAGEVDEAVSEEELLSRLS